MGQRKKEGKKQSSLPAHSDERKGKRKKCNLTKEKQALAVLLSIKGKKKKGRRRTLGTSSSGAGKIGGKIGGYIPEKKQH